MNKQSKQSLIKIAIVIGVMILSAFLTSSYAYFAPNHGDVSTSTNLSRSIPSGHYTVDQLVSIFFLCANTNAGDGTSHLGDEGRYSSGNSVRAFQTPPSTKRAEEARAGMVSMSSYSMTLPGMRISGATQVYWGPPTPPQWVGTEEIKLTYLKPTGGNYSESHGGGHVDTDPVTITYEPPYKQDGGLRSEQLVYRIVNKDNYLDSTVRVLERDTQMYSDVKYRTLGFGNMWQKIINHSKAYPVYTTCIGDAHEATYHEHKS